MRRSRSMPASATPAHAAGAAGPLLQQTTSQQVTRPLREWRMWSCRSLSPAPAHAAGPQRAAAKEGPWWTRDQEEAVLRPRPLHLLLLQLLHLHLRFPLFLRPEGPGVVAVAGSAARCHTPPLAGHQLLLLRSRQRSPRMHPSSAPPRLLPLPLRLHAGAGRKAAAVRAVAWPGQRHPPCTLPRMRMRR